MNLNSKIMVVVVVANRRLEEATMPAMIISIRTFLLVIKETKLNLRQRTNSMEIYSRTSRVRILDIRREMARARIMVDIVPQMLAILVVTTMVKIIMARNSNINISMMEGSSNSLSLTFNSFRTSLIFNSSSEINCSTNKSSERKE